MSCGRRRGAVGHHENSGFIRLLLFLLRARRERPPQGRAGSVWGNTPCPRLKICPALRTGLARTSRAAWTPSLSPLRQRAGSRLPCTGRSPTRRRPSSRSTCQSMPSTVEPACVIRSRSSPVPTPKRMVGTLRSRNAVEDACVARSAKRSYSSRVSEPAQESKSCSARAPWATWKRKKGDRDRDQTVQQSVKERGVGVHQALDDAEIARGRSLDEIARHGERRAGKTNERCVVASSSLTTRSTVCVTCATSSSLEVA